MTSSMKALVNLLGSMNLLTGQAVKETKNGVSCRRVLDNVFAMDVPDAFCVVRQDGESVISSVHSGQPAGVNFVHLPCDSERFASSLLSASSCSSAPAASP